MNTNIVYTTSIGRVAEVQDGKDNWRVLNYDSLDRLTGIEYRGADRTLQATEPYVAYTYDRDGNQLTEVSREEGAGTVRTRTMTYDALQRVTYESLPSVAVKAVRAILGKLGLAQSVTSAAACTSWD